MTAAGTSAQDTLHSLYDGAASLLGYGSQNQGEADKSGDLGDTGSQKTEEGYISGPGNHPSSQNVPKQDHKGHDHSEYKDDLQYREDTDTKIDEPGASVGRNVPNQQDASSEDEDRGLRKTESGVRADALERALGDEGPIGKLTGAKLGRELEADAYAKRLKERNEERDYSTGEDNAVAIAGASVGEPVQSQRNNPEEIAAKRKEKNEQEDIKGHPDDSDEDEEEREKAKKVATEQHIHQKGPMWASKPDESQRQKLKQIAEEKRKRDREAKEMGGGSGFRSWAKLRLGSTKSAVQGEQAEGGQQEGPAPISGLDLLRDPQDNTKEAREAREAKEKRRPSASPNISPTQEKSGSRLSSFFHPAPGQGKGSQRRSSQRQDSGDGAMSDKDAEPVTIDEQQTNDASGSHDQQPSQSEEDKMTRISKLMRGGGSGRRSSTGPQSDTVDHDESGDTTTGIDGVQISGGSMNAGARWGALRRRLRENAAKRSKASEPKARVVGHMSVVTELQTGILPVFMLKMAMERDEQGHRRIPVLLNHLRLRIADSVNAMNSSSAIFRIELEYGDGLVKWVCYRSLRDFINLHTHYRAAAIKGYLGRPVGANEGDVGLPSFPKTSLPYLNQLQRQGWTKQSNNVKADFAKAQRDALEDYIIELIKRTMFRPEANRLCKFFEISALSISLATRGGFQGKQGYLRILSKASRKDAQKGILTPYSWKKSHDPKWFIVRESYIVIVDEPDSLQVHDVFLVDGSFEIERPKRLYKQTIHLAHELGHREKGDDEGKKGKTDEDKFEKTKGAEGEAWNEKNLSKDVQGNDDTAILTDGQFKGQKQKDGEEADGAPKTRRHDPDANVSSHTFYIKNAERKIKLVAKTERQMDQFIASMERVARRNIFSKSNRFGSFAPIRLNCNAQWLIDGRDYYWQVSRALTRAKDRIFIHDWWLSPELYLRRPGTPKYRLDHILKKKAEEGVKIFVIVYNEVSNNFTPTDSNYTKQRLIGLHRNIYVQRSPSHFQTGTFYWAHHEKLCVVDETIAFMGGFDLCFGRWDTPSHLLTDHNISEPGENVKPQHHETLLGPGVEGKEFYVWPGQDFANERVVEWYDLTKPEQDLFDRHQHPRMPWHDIGVQLIGQPARDLCRHFAQRWNYLLRIKNHKRLMPFLVPPPDFLPHELKQYDLTGTCEAQICRSAGPWSMGTTSTIEHSIQNAYLKAIQMSEHFVYIENQFFVTSTETRGTVIENQIGEALVSRIIRAHREQTPWKAVIVIPLIPGFPMPVEHPDASSVRLILELQNRSICRGEHSIFGKLRRQGIDPDNYIVFCSLRQWGRLPSGQLTTEQVYIHAKAMIVDDRLALIGSANINERSQRGDRDSELACVIRDTDFIDSTMAGKPFKVGRFAHTMRVRLMKEHLGLDVDELDQEGAKIQDVRPKRMLDEDDQWDPSNEQSRQDVEGDAGKTHVHERTQLTTFGNTIKEAIVPMSDGAGQQAKEQVAKMMPFTTAHDESQQTSGKAGHSEQDKDKLQSSDFAAQKESDRIRSVVDQGQGVGKDPFGMGPTAEERHMAGQNGLDRESSQMNGNSATHRDNGSAGMNGEEMKRSMSAKLSINPWAPPINSPYIDPDLFKDPLDDRFFRDMWMASAIHNTQIFRKVFKSVPDDTVTTWAEYKAFNAWAERLARSGVNKFQENQHQNQHQNQHHPSKDAQGNGTSAFGTSSHAINDTKMNNGSTHKVKEEHNSSGLTQDAAAAANPSSNTTSKNIPKPPSSNDEGFSAKELEQMERLLEETRGTLVLHCTRFLEAEDRSDNLLFPMDKINPLNVYD